MCFVTIRTFWEAFGEHFDVARKIIIIVIIIIIMIIIIIINNNQLYCSI